MTPATAGSTTMTTTPAEALLATIRETTARRAADLADADEALAARNTAIRALHALGWSYGRIARELADLPGMSMGNVRNVVEKRGPASP